MIQAVTSCFQFKRCTTHLLEFIAADKPMVGDALADPSDEKLAHFVRTTAALKIEYRCAQGPSPRVFELALAQLRALNRIAEWESGWVVYPLYTCARQLVQMAAALDARTERAAEAAQCGDLATEDHLTQCGRAVHMSLNLCLKDRDPAASNKRHGAYYFALLLFRTYARLGAHSLVTNMVKVLESRAQDLPPVERAFGERRALTVTYCYYLGRYHACRRADYEKGFRWLNTALLTCHRDHTRHHQLILTYLVPVAFLARRWYPKHHVIAAWPPPQDPAAIHYAALVAALRSGDLGLYDRELVRMQLPLLRRGLYLPLSHLRPYILLRLVKAVWRLSGGSSQLPIRIIAAALAYSTSATPDAGGERLLDHTECLLANLIARGYVKGYLSHGNRVLVVSRTEPFPRLVRSETAA
ncbi:ACR179Cp [Eremothecium gossypii ATCC 10895]|uniref:COP9 signalosome complex subunit 12 n=1 Tax=Eremothecium gossypii (strain ATCC 10895 / CBS 109.51 / FGSC 9923 / NRRL Y-1056) TaxID=284811 RepID=CSN12_EREGS|nr:ACR179Cp [Eremothecium gossypii ATCC 10895]Q75BU2.2 RecName: Full=COP9 signalosome complex subunit 12 [Eremothecium gossypii ATCC 10895]AAS51405.2 ACR179Cp [Eremothecium gossypii ATCC 10895]